MTKFMLVLFFVISSGDPPNSAQLNHSTKSALRVFADLIGAWKGTGYPEGISREERAQAFWSETIDWSWQFKKEDIWLQANFDKSKYFKTWELRFSTDNQQYQIIATTIDKTTQKYSGTLKEKEKVLTLTRDDPPEGESQQLVLTLLHGNRYLYRLETRPRNSTTMFTKKYQVGATKQGVPFAEIAKGPECIVSGGHGTIKVTYNGKDYNVCCSGCRDAFKEDPEKFIKEAAAKKK